jgi:hypothetical protein
MKICVYRSTSAGDNPDKELGPLYTIISGAWEDHVKLRALAYSLRPRGSVCIVHANFFRSSYDLFLQALLLFFNRSVKRLAKLKSNEYNGLSGNRGIP